jgi:hypothetical protein
VKAERLQEELDATAPPKPGAGLFPLPWNWDSPAQALSALKQAGCEITNTSDDTLAASDNPLAQLLRDYRVARKRGGTCGTEWLKHVADDGRVYPSWWQMGASSGRMSCSAPNMQQLPRCESPCHDLEHPRSAALPGGLQVRPVLVHESGNQIIICTLPVVLGDQLAETAQGGQVRGATGSIIGAAGEKVLLASNGATVCLLGFPVPDGRFRAGLHGGILR